jgi:hypothetical protein
MDWHKFKDVCVDIANHFSVYCKNYWISDMAYIFLDIKNVRRI